MCDCECVVASVVCMNAKVCVRVCMFKCERACSRLAGNKKHAVQLLLKSPSRPPQHYGCHQDGPCDGAYDKVGGARTCRRA